MAAGHSEESDCRIVLLHHLLSTIPQMCAKMACSFSHFSVYILGSFSVLLEGHCDGIQDSLVDCLVLLREIDECELEDSGIQGGRKGADLRGVDGVEGKLATEVVFKVEFRVLMFLAHPVVRDP